MNLISFWSTFPPIQIHFQSSLYFSSFTLGIIFKQQINLTFSLFLYEKTQGRTSHGGVWDGTSQRIYSFFSACLSLNLSCCCLGVRLCLRAYLRFLRNLGSTCGQESSVRFAFFYFFIICYLARKKSIITIQRG